MRARLAGALLLVAAVSGAVWLGYRLKAGAPYVASSPAAEAVPAARQAPASRLDHPILLVGLDGADRQILDPLIEAGRLPNLARLEARSVRGHMRSSEPILSPLLWTTAATGRPPDEHGIIDFLVPDPVTGRRAPITSASRKVRALWNIFDEKGLTTDVVAWWASWPAEPIRGRIVSDRVAYSLFDIDQAGAALTHPDALWKEIRPDVVSDESVTYERVSRFVDVPRAEFEAARKRARETPATAWKEPVNHLAKILAAAASYHAIALRLLRGGQPDLTMVYYQGIDEVCHRFMHYAPPRLSFVSDEDVARYGRAVEEYYVYQDELLGELLAAADPDSTVIVMSDHGFQNGGSRPADGPADIEGKPGKWHRLYGVVMVAGHGIAPGELDTATLLDIAPTVLALAGLPLAADMKGSPLVRMAGKGEPERIATYETGARRGAGAEAGEPAGGMDEELLRNLESLGYIGGTATEESPAVGAAALTLPAAETVTAHTNLASLLVQKGDLPGAERQLRAALEIKPAYTPALMTLSQVLVRQGKVEEALAATRKAVATAHDTEHAAYVQLALLASRAGQARQAYTFLEALRGRRPGAGGIQTALGVLELARGEGGGGEGARRAAEARYRAALVIEPASPEAMARLFQLYREEGREAELEEPIRRALALNDRSILHRNWLGLILARRGDAPGAEKELKRALELAPDFGGTMANLGSLYGRTGRLEEAVTVLARALRIEPRNLEARVNLGGSLAKLGRLDEAIANLEEARRMGLRSPELLNAMGLAYAEKGRTREAIEALRESLTLSPRQPQVEALLAELTRPT